MGATQFAPFCPPTQTNAGMVAYNENGKGLDTDVQRDDLKTGARMAYGLS
jgi:hypothetical protein